VRSALLLVSPFPTAADRAPSLINGRTRGELVNETLSFHLEDAQTKIAASVAATTATDRIRPCESLHLGPRCHSPTTTDDRLPNPTGSADRPLLRTDHALRTSSSERQKLEQIVQYEMHETPGCVYRDVFEVGRIGS
jgi:hypothetical protein